MYTFRRKSGLGTHRFKMGGQVVKIKSGQTVTCDPSDLGEKHLSNYECLDSEGQVAAEPTPNPRVPEIVPASKQGFYNVVNPDHPDRPLNEKPLRKGEAKKFIQDFTTPEEGSDSSSEEGSDSSSEEGSDSSSEEGSDPAFVDEEKSKDPISEESIE